ncbi:MAG: hypothetical protein ACJ749_11125 [Flavisolibacter sp.]
MRNILLILSIVLAGCSTGSKWCKEKNIQSGRSSQHHDRKKYKAMIRVKWTHQFGNMCLVKFENMKQSFSKIYDKCDCRRFKVGSWVAIDSI